MLTVQDMRPILRVTTDAFDAEIDILIHAAYADMERVGIDEDEFNTNRLTDQAVICYVKAHFGYDNEEAYRFDKSYRQTVTDLLHSEANIASRSQDALQ